YKQRVIAQAIGEAERFNKLYAEYRLAPDVTRDRMYIDMMESVMSNSTKVMIDIEGGNNILYLPLDKIIQQSQDSGGVTRPQGRGSGSTNTVNLPPNTRRDRR
ncbi:MAG: protease modulator HflK, partial [Gammaproteobacteria bacterium]|nr:protease modulator HflK [Gammaproteobacteria bacterium]